VARQKNPERVMPLIEHIRELRNSILVSLAAFLVACVVAFVFSDTVISIFTRQFNAVNSVVEKKLVVTSIAEGFIAQVKMSAIAGLILSLPFHIFGLVKFIFPGLETKQRRIILLFLIASSLLIIAGTYFAYFKIVPLAVAFLTNPYFVPDGVGFMLNYQLNVFYVLSFILWAVLALQTPLFLEILLMMNVLNRKKVFAASRYIVVFIFLFSAVLTPPDFISQLGVALPLTFLYFLALLVAKLFKFGEG